MLIGTLHCTYNLGRIKMTQADLSYMMQMLSDKKNRINDAAEIFPISENSVKELKIINRCLKFLDRQQEDI